MHYIVHDRLPWSRVFGLMEQAKRDFNLQDYTVCQTTLEQVWSSIHSAHRAQNAIELQVFLDFAALQFTEE